MQAALPMAHESLLWAAGSPPAGPLIHVVPLSLHDSTPCSSPGHLLSVPEHQRRSGLGGGLGGLGGGSEGMVPSAPPASPATASPTGQQGSMDGLLGSPSSHHGPLMLPVAGYGTAAGPSYHPALMPPSFAPPRARPGGYSPSLFFSGSIGITGLQLQQASAVAAGSRAPAPASTPPPPLFSGAAAGQQGGGAPLDWMSLFPSQ